MAGLVDVAHGLPDDAAAPQVLAGSTLDVLAGIDDAWTLLSAVERDRATAFRFDTDREDFLAAHVLARVCVARLVDIAPSAVSIGQRCDDCGGEHGKPYVVGRPGVFVSWSHGGGYVAAGAAGAPIGVDVEVLGHVQLTDDLVDTVLSGADVAAVSAAAHPDRALLLQWAHKECLIKLGLANLDSISRIELTGLPIEPDDVPGRWRSWRDGMSVLGWWDGTSHAVGAAVTLTPQLGSTV